MINAEKMSWGCHKKSKNRQKSKIRAIGMDTQHTSKAYYSWQWYIKNKTDTKRWFVPGSQNFGCIMQPWAVCPKQNWVGGVGYRSLADFSWSAGLCPVQETLLSVTKNLSHWWMELYIAIYSCQSQPVFPIHHVQFLLHYRLYIH